MTNPLTRSQAKTWTIGAQAGALLCVLGAVAVGMVGLPEHEKGATLTKTRNNALPLGTTPGAGDSDQREIDPYRSQSVDTIGLAERLSLLDNAPNIPQEPVEPIIEDEDEDDDLPSVDDANLLRRIKYVGFINSSSSQHAFIRIDGKQRIVSVGQIAKAGEDQFEDVRIDRVTPNYIRVSDENGDATIDLASKTSAAVTMVNGDDVAPIAVQPESGSLLTPEEEAYIESLPPRQRQPARRRLEREKRGLPPENENRRPTPEPLVKIRGNTSVDGQPANVQRRNDRRDD